MLWPFLLYTYMTILIIILLIIICVLGYALFNILKKCEKYEDTIFSYQKYFQDFSNLINISDQKIKEIDFRGTFSSDDEVGYFFKQLKYIQEQLNNFKIK